MKLAAIHQKTEGIYALCFIIISMQCNNDQDVNCHFGISRGGVKFGRTEVFGAYLVLSYDTSVQ